MTRTQSEPTILPALRGVMGNWVYYSCLMQLGEVRSRIRFADEVHTHDGLSEMIQRSVDESRIQEIADYIIPIHSDDAMFSKPNSLDFPPSRE